MPPLTLNNGSFCLDGHPFRILSGAMHYFRVRPECWRDRLRKMRLMGLNTVETYTCWNLHEPTPGQFDFSGQLDLGQFLSLAKEEGLHAILRPGPYICAEWEFGGFPWWLLKDPSLRLRCHNAPYLSAVRRYLETLIPKITPHLSSRGGPIFMVQVENEYGSYGSDSAYLAWFEKTLKGLGVDVMLFTSDGPCDWMLQGGTLPHLLKTVNFGSRPEEAFATLRNHQPDKPLMCAEFWNGWFDHWGEKHHVRDPEDAATALDGILSAGASVNFYMFHGGTNFGFTSGANCSNGIYQPTIGSYDYDSPLDEAGDPTPKYHAFRRVIGKHASLPDEPVPPPAPKAAYGAVRLYERADLLDSLAALSNPIRSTPPEPMETFDQGLGVILYRTRLRGPRVAAELSIIGLADRAVVMLDGVRKGTISRSGDAKKLSLDIPADGATLDLLVEAMGRVNYGPALVDRKGITGGVTLNGQQFVYDWTVFPIPLDDLSRLAFASAAGPIARPAFLRGSFDIADEPLDTYLHMEGWQKGVCWINGFNLGRHWSIGPQMTHYVPAPLLKKGINEIIVLEFDGFASPAVEFINHPILGAT